MLRGPSFNVAMGPQEMPVTLRTCTAFCRMDRALSLGYHRTRENRRSHHQTDQPLVSGFEHATRLFLLGHSAVTRCGFRPHASILGQLFNQHHAE